MAGEAGRGWDRSGSPWGGRLWARLLSGGSWPRVSSQLSPGVSISPGGPLSAPVVGNEAWLHRETQTPSTAIRTLVIQITLGGVQRHELDLADKLICHLPEGAPPVESSRVQFPNWSSWITAFCWWQESVVNKKLPPLPKYLGTSKFQMYVFVCYWEITPENCLTIQSRHVNSP